MPNKVFRFNVTRTVNKEPEYWRNKPENAPAGADWTVMMMGSLLYQFDSCFHDHSGIRLFDANEKFCTDQYEVLVPETTDTGYIMANLKFVSKGYVTNAVDSLINAATEGNATRTLKVGMKLSADQSGNVKFGVRDNGTGIPLSVKKKLFNEKIQSEKYKGNGTLCGGRGNHLFYSKGYVERLGGKVGFEDYGKDMGARFFYSVPIANVVEAIKEGRHKKQTVIFA